MLTITSLQNGGSSNGTARLSKCGDGTYCCGWAEDCCTAVGEFSLAPTLVAIGNVSSSVTTVTATTTRGSTGNGNKVVAVGVGVGVSLGVLSAAMLGAGFLWGRRNTRAKSEGLQQAASERHMMLPAPQIHGSNPIYEAGNTHLRIHSELPGGK